MANIKRGTIGDILSFKKAGDRLLAALLYAVFFLSGCVGYLYLENKSLHKEINTQTIMDDQRYIDYLKNENANMTHMRYKLDSAKAEYEIFKIQKQMK